MFSKQFFYKIRNIFIDCEHNIFYNKLTEESILF